MLGEFTQAAQTSHAYFLSRSFWREGRNWQFGLHGRFPVVATACQCLALFAPETFTAHPATITTTLTARDAPLMPTLSCSDFCQQIGMAIKHF